MIFLAFFAIALIGMLAALLIVRTPGGAARGFWLGIAALTVATAAVVVALIVSPGFYLNLMRLG